MNVLPRDHEYYLPLTKTSVTSSRFAPVRTSALASFTGLLAAIAFVTPIWAPEPDRASGLLLLAGVAVEVVHSFRRKVAADQHAAWASAGFTPARPGAAEHGLAGGHRGRDLRGRPVRARRAQTRRRSGPPSGRRKPFLSEIGSALGNLAAVAGLLLLGRYAPNWIVAAAGARLLTVSANIAAGPSHAAGDAEESVIADIGLDRPERLAETGARLQAAEQNRVGPDREWIAAFLAVLFAIHVSRMGFDRSALGIFSPLVAVAGDIVVALALTYFVIVPFRLPPAHHACDRKGRMGACPECT